MRNPGFRRQAGAPERRRKPRRADDRRHHSVAGIAFGHIDECLRAISHLRGAAGRTQLRLDSGCCVGIADHGDLRHKAQALLDELIAIAMRT